MDSQHDIGSKDCRVCNRRRIRCDRRLPTCGKCEKRGLKCSGYGIILKWDQGVASRGSLKGQSVPVNSDKRSSMSPPVLELVARPKALEWQAERSMKRLNGAIPNPNFEIGAICTPLLSPQLHRVDARRLLHHYDRIVAPNMAWVDCPDNPWRHIIIPLALQFPPLLSSILAFAAKHVNAITFSNSRESTSSLPVSLSNIFQQQAVKLLAQEIHDFSKVSNSTFNISKEASYNQSNAILATMLVLCNVETVWPDSPVWQVHLNAARTVMASRRSSLSTKTREDTTSEFLEQELFVASTFASMTDFVTFMPNEDFKPSASEPRGIFVEFLKLLELVTSLERQAISSPAMLRSSGISPSGFRMLFEEARSRTLEMGKTYQSGQEDYLHLTRTVNCFYHAGLIYSHRALFKADSFSGKFDVAFLIERDVQIATSKAELFRFLSFTETNKPTFAQDLVWPLFIAGTEASEEDEQQMVVSKLQQSMSETGFSNCQHALEFLKALWERRGSEAAFGTEFDWISFGREWTQQGRTFLVF